MLLQMAVSLVTFSHRKSLWGSQITDYFSFFTLLTSHQPLATVSPHHLQPAHRPRAGGEAIGFDPHTLEHGDEEVGKRVV